MSIVTDRDHYDDRDVIRARSSENRLRWCVLKSLGEIMHLILDIYNFISDYGVPQGT